MTHNHSHKPAFYGTATIGTKGQIVIPIEARDDLGLQPGDKVVVIGIKEHGMVGVCKVAAVEQMIAQMSARLNDIRKVIDKTKAQNQQEG